jgi:hypothetical protein
MNVQSSYEHFTNLTFKGLTQVVISETKGLISSYILFSLASLQADALLNSVALKSFLLYTE